LEHGVNVIPPLESGLAGFNIFATSRYRGERSIYDIIEVQEQEEGSTSTCSLRYDFCDLGDLEFVHVMALLSFKGHDNNLSFFLIVADMRLCEKQTRFFPNYLYTYKTVQSIAARRKLTNSPVISCISIDTVVAPCCFTKLYSKPTEAATPVLTNVFILFDIKYCDRSGWNSTTITDADGVPQSTADGRLTLFTDDQIDSIVRDHNIGDDDENDEEDVED
jgi:hypothetical protein